jgi:hypothetical protein
VDPHGQALEGDLVARATIITQRGGLNPDRQLFGLVAGWRPGHGAEFF